MNETRRQHFSRAYQRLWNFLVLETRTLDKGAWSVLADQITAYKEAKDRPSIRASGIDHGPGTGKRVEYCPVEHFSAQMQRLDPYVESRYGRRA